MAVPSGVLTALKVTWLRFTVPGFPSVVVNETVRTWCDGTAAGLAADGSTEAVLKIDPVVGRPIPSAWVRQPVRVDAAVGLEPVSGGCHWR
jgi:hypothetical protein